MVIRKHLVHKKYSAGTEQNRIDKGSKKGKKKYYEFFKVVHLASLERAHSRGCIRIALRIHWTFLPGKGRKKNFRSGFIRR